MAYDHKGGCDCGLILILTYKRLEAMFLTCISNFISYILLHRKVTSTAIFVKILNVSSEYSQHLITQLTIKVPDSFPVIYIWEHIWEKDPIGN